MTGRGVDQILAHPGDPVLHERSVQDARTYVSLAERRSGSLPRQVSGDHIWGEALHELGRVDPHLRVINLETSITTSDTYWAGKAVHYRMHPRNIDCLTAARIDCCILANNHVLDWGYDGLEETIRMVRQAGIQAVGAGHNLEESRKPATFDLENGARLLIFAVGSPTSGVPASWSAAENHPGVWLVDEGDPGALSEISETVGRNRRPGDLVILSIHWGPNWGYKIPRKQRTFAHRVIDEASVDLVYGHSSHHVKGLEVYHRKLILYGCGDFLTDYEGIEGYERFRGDLGLMYFVTLAQGSADLIGLKLVPTKVEKFQVNRPSKSDATWLARVVRRESRGLDELFNRSDDRSIIMPDQEA